jgi:magnesium-transporting ATPase (P-type)
MVTAAFILLTISIIILSLHIANPEFIRRNKVLNKLINENGMMLGMLGIIIAFFLFLIHNQQVLIRNQQEMLMYLRDIRDLLQK